MIDRRVDGALQRAFPKLKPVTEGLCRAFRLNGALPDLLKRLDHSQVQRLIATVLPLDANAAARIIRTTYPMHPSTAFIDMPIMDELRFRRRISLGVMPTITVNWSAAHASILAGTLARYTPPGGDMEHAFLEMFDGSFAASRMTRGVNIYFDSDSEAVRGKLTAPEELFADE